MFCRVWLAFIEYNDLTKYIPLYVFAAVDLATDEHVRC